MMQVNGAFIISKYSSIKMQCIAKNKAHTITSISANCASKLFSRVK